jgi:hypothetical protein
LDGQSGKVEDEDLQKALKDLQQVFKIFKIFKNASACIWFQGWFAF